VVRRHHRLTSEEALQILDWTEWHDEYDDPDSELAARMRAVRTHVSELVERCDPGPVTIVSICGGQGRETIGALRDHARRADVRGRLVELDAKNAAAARRSAVAAQLDEFEVMTGDASSSDSYAGLPPADVVVVSGVLGHIDNDDRAQLVAFLRQLMRPGGSVVWTFFRLPGDRHREERLAGMRRLFNDDGFEEVAFELLPGDEYGFTVGVSRYTGERAPFRPHEQIFTFGSARRRRDDAASAS
jgi:SAM-dependent methyltransferase